jgi:hypothetical protein
MRTGFTAIALAIAIVAGSSSAEAVQYRVSAQTLGEAYQLVTVDEELLNRRRIHQYLRLGAYDLLDDGSYSLNVHTLMRFDTDLGISKQEMDRVSGTQQHILSVQAAFVEGRRLLGKSEFNLDFKAGRFLHIDALDFMMLDGVSATVTTPWYVGVQLIAGLESRNLTNPVTSSQFELDGARVIENTDLADAPSITIGAALMATGLNYTRAKLSYRRMFSTQQPFRLQDNGTEIVAENTSTEAGADSGAVSGVDSEKIGLSLFHSFWRKVDLNGVVSYDLYNGLVDQANVLARWRMSDAWDLSGQYVRIVPTFDADSIFNIFTIHPLNDANMRVRWHLSDNERVYLGGMLRLFGNESPTETQADIATSVKAYGAMAGYYRSYGHAGRVGADISAELGYGGDRVMGDVWGMWAPLPRELELDGRITVVHLDADLQPNLHGLSVGYQLGAKYLISDLAGISVMVEHNFNRIHTNQFRLFALVDLDVWL